MIDLCFLGTGGALPLPERGLASLFIRLRGRGILLDCGESTQTAIRRIGWGFKCIDALLITHFHADHCSGLPGFLLSMAKSGRVEPFHIYGGRGLKRVVEGLCVVAPQLPFEVVLHEFSGKEEDFSLLGMDVTAFQVNHSTQCYGFRFYLPHPAPFLPEKAKALQVPMQLWSRLQKGESLWVEGQYITPEDVMGAPRKGISFLYATDTRPASIISLMGEDTDLMILEGMYGTEKKLPKALKNKHMLFR